MPPVTPVLFVEGHGCCAIELHRHALVEVTERDARVFSSAAFSAGSGPFSNTSISGAPSTPATQQDEASTVVEFIRRGARACYGHRAQHGLTPSAVSI